MVAMKDERGNRFGRLTVEGLELNAAGRRVWRCLCDCGNVTTVPGHELRQGNTRSCGCLRREMISQRRRKHGLAGTGIYRSWADMLRRCENPTHKSYSNYGGRGVKVCDEWRDVETFRDWALSNGWKKSLTIERKDSNGDYMPDNCEWIELGLQPSNTRRNRPVIRGDGKRYAMIADAARDMGGVDQNIDAACRGKQIHAYGFRGE